MNFESTKKAAIKVVFMEHFEKRSDDEIKKIKEFLTEYGVWPYIQSPYTRLPKLPSQDVWEIITIVEMRRKRKNIKNDDDDKEEAEIELDDEV